MDTTDPLAPQGQLAEDTEPKKKKKPNFNKPWIKAGIFLGIVSGIPFLNLLNMVVFLWAWVAGLIAARSLSKEFPRMQITHGAVVGLFTGLLGALIACILICGVSVGGFYFTHDDSKPAEEQNDIWGTYLYPPGQIYVQNEKVHDILFRPYPDNIKPKIYMDMTDPDVTESIGESIAVNLLFWEVALAIFAALGGTIGALMWSKPLPKGPPPRKRTRKSVGGPKRPRIAGAPSKPVYAKPVEEPAEAPPAEGEKPQTFEVEAPPEDPGGDPPPVEDKLEEPKAPAAGLPAGAPEGEPPPVEDKLEEPEAPAAGLPAGAPEDEPPPPDLKE